jgi:triosephosphate isomerase
VRKPIIAGNWKMHYNPIEAEKFIQELKPLVINLAVEVVVCPPFIDLPVVLKSLTGSSIKVGAQNMHWEEKGAFTGEISSSMLLSMGVSYVIIGHSERRQYFGETDEIVNKKVKAAFVSGLQPILCVGETLEEREAGKTRDVVQNQVEKGLSGLTGDNVKNLVIAYEPIWAIGTGKTASSDDAEAVISQIRLNLSETYGADAAQELRILYGGSVKPENITELMSKPNIDGALVGGASLKADSFSRIVGF